MSMRFCPKCNGDVEASRGYCLLGHRLALDPPVSSIAELRAEIDQAFEGSTLEVAGVESGGSAPAATSASQATVSVSPQTTVSAAAPQPASGAVAAPARPRRVGPPPPPPPRRPAAVVSVTTDTSAPVSAPGQVPTPEQIVKAKGDVWKELEDDIDLVGDPISSFAPPPTMDWGPRESKLRRKPSRSLGRSKRSKDAADQI